MSINIITKSTVRVLNKNNPFLTKNRSSPFSTITYVSETFMDLHEACNLPWVVLIPLSTIALRTAITLPLSILQRKRSVKQNELRNVVSSITPVVKLRLAQTQKVTPEQIMLLSVKETRKRQKKLFKKYGVDMWKNAMLPLVQVPLWVTISLSIRKLTENTLPLRESNDVYNFIDPLIDLSLPYSPLPLMMPIILGTMSMINVEYNGVMFSKRNNNIGINNAKMNNAMSSILNVSRISSAFMIGVSSQTSMLLSLYWITSQLYSLLQNLILDCLWPLHNKNSL